MASGLLHAIPSPSIHRIRRENRRAVIVEAVFLPCGRRRHPFRLIFHIHPSFIHHNRKHRGRARYGTRISKNKREAISYPLALHDRIFN